MSNRKQRQPSRLVARTFRMQDSAALVDGPAARYDRRTALHL